ncbi:hypothetical protein ECB94_27130 (plasmid) [Vibrio mediterranei]|uniref:Uncharacterized protein n=1 Tax=Vibrio mediterranei TaxID=689 RepID=A0A3G4VKT7_9VIBR|nr:hypothetical protein ECB94_27130 [Vibrio mediterranei]
MTLITHTIALQNAPVLTSNKHRPLIIKNQSKQHIARFLAPKGGWTQWDVWQAIQQLPPKWGNESLSLYLGDTFLTTESPKK